MISIFPSTDVFLQSNPSSLTANIPSFLCNFLGFWHSISIDYASVSSLVVTNSPNFSSLSMETELSFLICPTAQYVKIWSPTSTIPFSFSDIFFGSLETASTALKDFPGERPILKANSINPNLRQASRSVDSVKFSTNSSASWSVLIVKCEPSRYGRSMRIAHTAARRSVNRVKMSFSVTERSWQVPNRF